MRRVPHVPRVSGCTVFGKAPGSCAEKLDGQTKKIGPTVPEDLTTYTRQKSLFDEEEPEPSCFCD